MDKWGIIFFDNDSLLSNTIEALTGEWSHCGFLHPDGMHVSDIDFKRPFETRHLNEPYGTYEVIYLELNTTQCKQLVEFIAEHKGADYDITGALSNVLFCFGDDPEEFYCSEIIRDALVEIGYIKRRIDEPITPTQLYKILGGTQ